MKIDQKSLDNHRIEITVRVSKSDAQSFLAPAAARLSQSRPVKGFRPGKAPLEIVQREFGETALIGEAMEDIINGTFGTVLEEQQLDTYGRIGFDLLPVTDANEAVAYKATITKMPKVTLGDWQKAKIKKQEVTASEEDLNKSLDELAGMMVSEAQVEREAAMDDKVVMDFEVSVDGQVIEGGTSSDFSLVLGEKKMIPGFEEKIVGAKAGQDLEFDLNFPDEYHAAHLSGKPAKFKVKIKQVLARTKPAMDDELAKRVGLADLAELKAKLSENIVRDKQQKEQERMEIAAIKQLTDTAKFTDLPPQMIDDTVADLVHDFEHTLAHQGMKMDQYLQTVNKTLDQIKLDFQPKAIERIKSSMALGQLAQDEKITVDEKEIEEELALQRKTYAHNQAALKDLDRPEYRRHAANMIMNRKLINFLIEKMTA